MRDQIIVFVMKYLKVIASATAGFLAGYAV